MVMFSAILTKTRTTMKTKTTSRKEFHISLKVILPLILTLISNSCTEKDIQEIEHLRVHHTNDIILQDGWLVFKDRDVFMNHLNWITGNQTKPDELEAFNKNIGFKSMMEIYQESTQIVDDHEEYLQFVNNYPNVFQRVIEEENSMVFEIQAPPVFAYIANSDGLYQVGRTIYRVSYHYTYEIINGDKAKVEKILTTGDLIDDPSIRVKPTSLEGKGQYYYRVNYFDDSKRMVSRHYWSIIAGIYVYRVRTTGQSKVLGIWWQKKLNYIEVSWAEGYYRHCYYSFPDCLYPDMVIAPGFYSYTDAADIDIVFIAPEFPILFDVSYCYATHRGQLNSGGTILIRQDDALEDL